MKDHSSREDSHELFGKGKEAEGTQIFGLSQPSEEGSARGTAELKFSGTHEGTADSPPLLAAQLVPTEVNGTSERALEQAVGPGPSADSQKANITLVNEVTPASCHFKHEDARRTA